MNKLELFTSIVKNFGVQMRLFDEPFSLLEEYDNGLRLRLLGHLKRRSLKNLSVL